MGGPNVQKEEVTSQATPLAEDFLKILQGQLGEGAFGTGVGPLQREAGTALRQFISGLQGQGGVSAGADRLIGGIEERGEARIERGAADLREQGGILGQRFGSSLAQGEALFRSEAGAELDRTVGGIQQQQEQFDSNQLLAAISALFGFGERNVATVGQAAGLGIFPEEIIVSPSTGTQIISAGTGILDAVTPG